MPHALLLIIGKRSEANPAAKRQDTRTTRSEKLTRTRGFHCRRGEQKTYQSKWVNRVKRLTIENVHGTAALPQSGGVRRISAQHARPGHPAEKETSCVFFATDPTRSRDTICSYAKVTPRRTSRTCDRQPSSCACIAQTRLCRPRPPVLVIFQPLSPRRSAPLFGAFSFCLLGAAVVRIPGPPNQEGCAPARRADASQNRCASPRAWHQPFQSHLRTLPKSRPSSTGRPIQAWCRGVFRPVGNAVTLFHLSYNKITLSVNIVVSPLFLCMRRRFCNARFCGKSRVQWPPPRFESSLKNFWCNSVATTTRVAALKPPTAFASRRSQRRMILVCKRLLGIA